jgi:hypothetical protein
VRKVLELARREKQVPEKDLNGLYIMVKTFMYVVRKVGDRVRMLIESVTNCIVLMNSRAASQMYIERRHSKSIECELYYIS